MIRGTLVRLTTGLAVMIDFNQPASKCQGCGREIYWAKTPSGQAMPVVFMSHFADCPDAAKFRKEKEK